MECSATERSAAGQEDPTSPSAGRSASPEGMRRPLSTLRATPFDSVFTVTRIAETQLFLKGISIGHWPAAAAAPWPLACIRQILADLVHAELAAAVDKDSADRIPRELVVQYVVGAYIAVLTWWLDGGAKLPPQHIDATFRHLATEGIMRSRR